MQIENIFSDKSLKPKTKTEILSQALLDQKISTDALIEFAGDSKDPVKASCIEALEFATKKNPAIANKKCFDFAVKALADKAPRIKWESAKVIANTVQLFPGGIDKAIANLLTNTEHSGTVVRWSAAQALSQIILLKSKFNKDLLPAFENICQREEKNSIKKIYLVALKKLSK